MAFVQYKNIEVLRKNARRPFYNFFDVHQMRRIEAHSGGSSLAALTLYYEEEQIKLHGVAKMVKRLYIHDPNSASPLSKIGWLLDEDVDYCMICSSLFNFNNSKSHCRACGNIICKLCSPSRIPFTEATGLGPQRVCNLCYYGQTSITVIPTSPEKIRPDRNSTKNSPVRDSKSALNPSPNPNPNSAEPRRESSSGGLRSGLSNLFGKRKSLLSSLFLSVDGELDDHPPDIVARDHLKRDPAQQLQSYSPASSVTSYHVQQPSASAPLSAAFNARNSEHSTTEGFSSPPQWRFLSSTEREAGEDSQVDKNNMKFVLVADGIVNKVNSLHMTKVRRLLLTTKPSLLYMKPSGEIKGEIPWSSDYPCTASIVDRTHFEVFSKARVYKFFTSEGDPHDARYWADNINTISKNFSR